MQDKLKIVMVTLFALVFALVAQLALQPPQAQEKQRYQQVYEQMHAKAELTEADKQQLETMFREINDGNNIKSAMIETAIRFGAFYLVLIPLTLWGAFKLTMSKEHVLVSAGLVFLVFILAGSPITGGITAALFVLFSLGRRPREPDGEPTPD